MGTQCVEHRADQSGRCGNRTGFASALGAERIEGEGLALVGLIDERIGHILRAQEAVVEEGAGQQLPAVGVVDTGFLQRLTQPLSNTTMQLPFDDHRIDHGAGVVGRDVEKDGVIYSQKGTSEAVMRSQFKAWAKYMTEKN